jgi:hypothetical protein
LAEAPFGGIEPDVEITSELILERLGPQIEVVRTEIFGSPEPPFQTFAEAEAWIDGEASKKVEKNQTESLDRLAAVTAKLQARWSRHIGAPASLRLNRPVLEYLSINGGRSLVSAKKICFGTGLLRLKEFTGPASEETGLEEHFLVSHVLSGAPPYLTGISVRHQLVGDPLRPPHVTITVRKRVVRWKDLEAAYAFVQDLKEAKHPVVLADRKDRAILSAIQRRGKLPPGRVPGQWWDEIAEELHPRFPELTPDAVRMRTRRMEKEKGLTREALYRDADETEP